MKLKMLETFQGVNVTALNVAENMPVTILEAGEVYEVDANTAAFLLEHHKAEQAEETPAKQPKHYGAQAEPELRHDDELYEEVKAESEAPAEEEPIMSTENQATTRKPKRSKK